VNRPKVYWGREKVDGEKRRTGPRREVPKAKSLKISERHSRNRIDFRSLRIELRLLRTEKLYRTRTLRIKRANETTFLKIEGDGARGTKVLERSPRAAGKKWAREFISEYSVFSGKNEDWRTANF